MAVAITRPNAADIAGVSASGNVASYSGVDIGAAAVDRIVVVCIGTELNSSAPTAVTIDSGGGAVAMTHAEAATQGAVTSDIWYLAVPTGTSATIAITFGATNPTDQQNHIAVYRVVGVNAAAAPFDTGQVADTDADPITSGALTINADGAGIAICADATDTVARTWTGFTEDLDVDAGAFRFSTGTLAGASTPTITVSGGNNEDGALSWIIFNAGVTNQTLTATLFANSQTYQTQVLSAGAVTLSPTLYADGETFFIQAVGITSALTAALYENTNVFYTHTLSATYALTATLYQDGDTFYTQTVAVGAVTLAPTLYANDQTFYTQTLAVGAVTLAPTLYADDDTFYSHDLTQGYTVAPALYANAQTFYTHSLAVGAVNLSATLYADGDTFYEQSLSQGTSLQASLYANDNTFQSHALTVGVVDLGVTLYSDGDMFYNQTLSSVVALTADLYTDGDTFYAADLVQFFSLLPTLHEDGDTFYTAVVDNGGVELLPALFEDSDTFYALTAEPPRRPVAPSGGTVYARRSRSSSTRITRRSTPLPMYMQR